MNDHSDPFAFLMWLALGGLGSSFVIFTMLKFVGRKIITKGDCGMFLFITILGPIGLFFGGMIFIIKYFETHGGDIVYRTKERVYTKSNKSKLLGD